MRTPIAAVLAALLVASPALAVDPALRKKAGDPDSFKRSDAARELGKLGTPEAAKLLVALLADRNPYVRDHTVKACAGLTDEAAAKVLTGALRVKGDLGRRNAAEALGRTRTGIALEKLALLAAKDRAPVVRAQALDWTWGWKKDARALAIAAAAMDDRDPLVRAAAVEAAGRICGDGALDLVRKGLADEDEGVRCVARMELRFLDAGAALEGLAAATKASGWRTRAQAVEDARSLRAAPAVDALVTLVGDESLRVAGAAHRALRALSGKAIGRDRDLWRAWWEQARKDWTPPKGRLDAKPATGDDGHSRARFHGIEVDSERVVFLLDISGSMADEVADRKTRWDLVREELERTLAALPDGTLLTVLTFAERVDAAFPRLVKLNPKTRRELATFARRADPGDRGDLLGAMERALDVEGADTVFLLTDGAPSAGDMVDKGRVRYAIRQRNRMAKRAILAVGFGSRKKSERQFLGDLARDSGGSVTFRE